MTLLRPSRSASRVEPSFALASNMATSPGVQSIIRGSGKGHEAIQGLREQIIENGQFVAPPSAAISVILSREAAAGGTYKAILLRAHGSRREALLQSDSCATPVCALENLLTRSADAVQEYISQHGYRQLLGTYRGNYGEDDEDPEEKVSEEGIDEMASVSFVGKEPKPERVHGDQGQGQSKDQDQDQALEPLADSRLALGEEEEEEYEEYEESAYDSISEDEIDYAGDVSEDDRFGKEDGDAAAAVSGIPRPVNGPSCCQACGHGQEETAAAQAQEYVYENQDPASGKQQRPVAGESQTPTFSSKSYAVGGQGCPNYTPGTGRQSVGGLQKHSDLRQYVPLRPHVQQQQQQPTTTTATRIKDSASMGYQNTNGFTARQQQYQQPPPTVLPTVKLPPSAFMHHGPAAAAAAAVAAAAATHTQRTAIIPSVPAASNTVSSPTTTTTTSPAVANQAPSQASVPPSCRMLATVPPSQATFVPPPGSTTSTLSAGTLIPTPTSSSASSPSSLSSPLPSTSASVSAPLLPGSNPPATTVATRTVPAVNKKIDYRLVIKMHNMARRGSGAPTYNHSPTTATPHTVQYRIMAHGVPTRDEMRSVALRYVSEIFDLALSPYQPAAASTLLVGGVDHSTSRDTNSLSNAGTLIPGTTFHGASSLSAPAPAPTASYALATSTTAGLFTNPANTTTAGAGAGACGSTYHHQGGSEGTMSFICTVVSRVSFAVDAVLGTQEVYDLANYGEDDFGWLCENMAKRVSGGGNGMAGGERGRDGPWALPLFEVVCSRIWT